MLIAPSLLAADFLHLSKEVETVNAHADIFHLDIMDGTFVPNISWKPLRGKRASRWTCT